MWERFINLKNPVLVTEPLEQELCLIEIEHAEALLKRYPDHLYQLKQLISVTTSDYDYFYSALIKKAAVFMQQLPSLLYSPFDQSYGLLTLALDRTIAVLKYRRAYMLPIGADTETCYKEQDVWTYALFTAALLKDIWQVSSYFEIALFDKQQRFVNNSSLAQPFAVSQAYYYQFTLIAIEQRTECCDSTAIIKALLPETGLAWLKSHAGLFKVWEACFINAPSLANVLFDIIHQAEAAITKTTAMNTVLAQPPVAEVKEEKKETKATEVVAEKLLQSEEILPTVQAESPLVERFIQWLKHAIKEDTLGTNQREGVLHHVAEGILIVMPAIYEQFQQYEGNAIKVVTKRDKHRFLKALLAIEDYFIAPTSLQALPRYYWGDWHERQLVEGLLMVPTVLFQADALPALNPHLHFDPDLNS